MQLYANFIVGVNHTHEDFDKLEVINLQILDTNNEEVIDFDILKDKYMVVYFGNNTI